MKKILILIWSVATLVLFGASQSLAEKYNFYSNHTTLINNSLIETDYHFVAKFPGKALKGDTWKKCQLLVLVEKRNKNKKTNIQNARPHSQNPLTPCLNGQNVTVDQLQFKMGSQKSIVGFVPYLELKSQGPYLYLRETGGRSLNRYFKEVSNKAVSETQSSTMTQVTNTPEASERVDKSESVGTANPTVTQDPNLNKFITSFFGNIKSIPQFLVLPLIGLGIVYLVYNLFIPDPPQNQNVTSLKKRNALLQAIYNLVTLPISILRFFFKEISKNIIRVIVLIAIIYVFFTAEFTQIYSTKVISWTQSQVKNINIFNISSFASYDSQRCKKIRLKYNEMEKIRDGVVEKYKFKLSFLGGATLGSLLRKDKSQTRNILGEAGRLSRERDKLLQKVDVRMRVYQIDNPECFEK